MNFLIMNSAGKYYSRAGSHSYWVSNESSANVYRDRADAELDARHIHNNRADYGLPGGDGVKVALSPLFIEETELPVSP